MVVASDFGESPKMYINSARMFAHTLTNEHSPLWMRSVFLLHLRGGVIFMRVCVGVVFDFYLVGGFLMSNKNKKNEIQT